MSSPSAPAIDPESKSTASVRGRQTSQSMAVWLGALLCFVLAGSTGAFFRAAPWFGWTAGFDLGNVRHAHSHLMYFGWVMPAAMAILATHLSSRRIRTLGWATLWLAALSYPPFFLYGYGMATVGSMQLPLSVILATANLLAWYVLAGFYVMERGKAPDAARGFWDGAVGLLVLSSIGAWGLGVVQAIRPESSFWFAAALHLFLDLFAHGWILLFVLGCAALALDSSASLLLRWSRRLLIGAVPFTFVLSIPPSLVPPSLNVVGALGGLFAGIGALGVLVALLRAWGQRDDGGFWLPGLIAFLVVALAWIGMSIPDVGAWGLDAGLRIPYLHILLLGGATLGLWSAARATWGPGATPGHGLFVVASVLLLVSLWPLTGIFPGAWRGSWVMRAVLAGAAAPVLAAVYTVVRLGVTARST
ncbi:hypothetical protein [Longibacter salinarum]|nr:hypothetical protein [Longibacter salinarum]